MQEAIEIFNHKYPFGRDPPNNSPLTSFGMYNHDNVVKRKSSSSGKRLVAISKQQAKASFSVLAKLQGQERALHNMVKALPICLAFDKIISGAGTGRPTGVGALLACSERTGKSSPQLCFA
jgi:hypothetical protein